MLKTVILIVGLPGSGKSTVANFLKKKLDAAVFLSGDVIRDEIRRRGMKYTPENDAKMARWFHTGREHLVVKRVWEKAERSRKRFIVIDGFRSEKELEYLEKISKSRPVVIAIVASQNVRVRRELSRGRFGEAQNVRYVKFRDRLEKSHGIMELMRRADYRIDNTHLSVGQTCARISKIIKDMRSKLNLNS